MQFVTASPSDDHAAHFIRLAQMAGDELFTQMFGSRAAHVLRLMFLREDNDFSHSHTRFLQIDGEIAGMLHACAAPETRDGKTTALMMLYAGWQLPRFLVIAFMLGDVLSFMGSDLRDIDYYITFLAVYPDFRGRGLSQALLEQAWAQARERGCTRLALDVDARNQVAIGAYQKAGFTQIAKSKTLEIDGEKVGVLRMATAGD